MAEESKPHLTDIWFLQLFITLNAFSVARSLRKTRPQGGIDWGWAGAQMLLPFATGSLGNISKIFGGSLSWLSSALILGGLLTLTYFGTKKPASVQTAAPPPYTVSVPRPPELRGPAGGGASTTSSQGPIPATSVTSSLLLSNLTSSKGSSLATGRYSPNTYVNPISLGPQTLSSLSAGAPHPAVVETKKSSK